MSLCPAIALIPSSHQIPVNKVIKDHLCASFRAWHSQKVSEQLGEGNKPEDIKIDMRLSILKEMQAKWIVSACDHIKSHPEFAVNGFRAAGIIKAIEQPETLTDDTRSEEDDPFAYASESDSSTN